MVMRHRENVSWAQKLDPCVVGKVTICNTGPALGVFREVRVRNTGREAGCILHMLLRYSEPAPHFRRGIVAFVQARPHCASGSTEFARSCVARSLRGLRASKMNKQGGFVPLSDTARNNAWLPEWLLRAEPCFNSTFQTLTGMSPERAASLKETLVQHAFFQIGAQFAVTWAAVRGLPADLRGWLERAQQHLERPDLAVVPYNHNDCCAAGHTCLPWMLERTYEAIFRLAACRHATGGVLAQNNHARRSTRTRRPLAFWVLAVVALAYLCVCLVGHMSALCVK